MHIFRRFLPTTVNFFEMFSRHSQLVVLGADALQAMLNRGDDEEQQYKAVLRHEDDADVVTREVVTAVQRTFVTPFDRSSIQALISAMDDTIDQMKKTAKSVHSLRVREFEPAVPQMAVAIVRCANLMYEAVPLLSSVGANQHRINEICEQIRRVEGEADDLNDQALADLFRKCEASGNSMAYIAGREILDNLEHTVDLFDDAANRISNIVIEHV